MDAYPIIKFSQYSSDTPDDDLLIFAAPAKAIAKWAGIPRKGWHIRMLYQRWITPGRETELKEFWDRASTESDDQLKKFILGPTALTIAIHGEPKIQDGRIVLDYTSPLKPSDDSIAALGVVAEAVLPSIKDRLSDEQQQVLEDFSENPYQEFPDVGNDYVMESALQILQMSQNPQWFVETNEVELPEAQEIVDSLESLCRPALVVDGQHRLFGAASCDNEVWLPVVAIPNCPWTEQIYQFVVINEKAKPIETSLLTDIFGSSLTQGEQSSLRKQLDRSKVDVEERIAAVIASREQASPFFNMVKIKLSGTPPQGSNPYITEGTIRSMIEGAGRGSRGWRTDEEFYDDYVSPTFPERANWENWTDGRWRDYWFAFWTEVREFYNEQVRRELRKDDALLWNPVKQTNLTRAVTLRLFQALFIRESVARVRAVEKSRSVLAEVLGEEEAEKKIKEKIVEVAIPGDVEEFRASVREWFLDKGIPVRFFAKKWKGSLDDPQGVQDLTFEMEKAFSYSQEGKRYHTASNTVFAVGEDWEL